ncbi:MAG: PAS domain S-box protein [Thermodesulfobacteriota bacterium]|nr:MAG: PAS domain S-box protein [Thermodesulfobacteriota bacterium]
MSPDKKAGPSSAQKIKRLEDEKKTLIDGLDQLRRSEDRFRKLVEDTSDLIWEVDENGVNTYMSPKIKEVLGYEPEDLVGKRPFDFMTPAEANFMAGVFKSIASERKRFSFSCLENINLHKDGHRVVLETSAVPIFDPGGAFRGYRGIDRVVTRRRQAEDELKRDIALQDSLNKAKLKSGLAPICLSCRRVLTQKGWESVQQYIAEHSEAEFSNGYCHECAERLHNMG